MKFKYKIESGGNIAMLVGMQNSILFKTDFITVYLIGMRVFDINIRSCCLIIILKFILVATISVSIYRGDTSY